MATQRIVGICLHFSEKYIDAYYFKLSKKQITGCFKNPIIPLNDDEIKKYPKLQDMYAQIQNGNSYAYENHGYCGGVHKGIAAFAEQCKRNIKQIYCGDIRCL